MGRTHAPTPATLIFPAWMPAWMAALPITGMLPPAAVPAPAALAAPLASTCSTSTGARVSNQTHKTSSDVGF